MDAAELEEKLRESSCNGDLETVRTLIEIKNIHIDCQNKLNGWSALHWAAKRNQKTIVSYLLHKGATVGIQNKDGETPSQLTTDQDIREMLGGKGPVEVSSKPLAITPNYIANPTFPYTQPGQQYQSDAIQTQHQQLPSSSQRFNQLAPDDELVLKIRLANSDERDFLEVELQRSNLTLDALMKLMCRELNVDRRTVYKIRKLPDTIVRKDKDVKRLRDFQELEIVLTTRAVSSSSRNYGGLSNGVRNEQILY